MPRPKGLHLHPVLAGWEGPHLWGMYNGSFTRAVVKASGDRRDFT